MVVFFNEKTHRLHIRRNRPQKCQQLKVVRPNFTFFAHYPSNKQAWN